MANVKPRHVPEQICDPTIIDTRNGPLPPLDDPAMRKAFVLEWITPASNPLIWRVVRELILPDAHPVPGQSF